MKRQSGILLPIFSLPSKFGIGSFGLEAYEFIDYLKSAKQSVWQILPLVQTGYGNSPYSSVCSYSFNPYFISLDLLLKDGLIDKKDLKTAEYDGKYIDASVSFVGAGFGIGWEKGVFKIKADLVGFPGLEISINFRQILEDLFGWLW